MAQSAVIIGAGNVAYHLTRALKEAGIDVQMVFTRSAERARQVSLELGVPATDSWDELPDSANCYLYAVTGNALPGLLSRFLAPGALHLHTAGSIGTDVFPDHKPRHGILYPLQTFSKYKAVDFKQVPLFIEASSAESEIQLTQLATLLSERVYRASSDQRRHLHLAAVFACNFVNHMYSIANDLVQTSGLPFEVLQPLIAETASKISVMSPREAQTGPALRKDSQVMDKHLDLLKEFPEYQNLYALISRSISPA